MKLLGNYFGQNWTITPVALALGEHPPASIHDQKFLLVLTGVVEANLQGSNTGDWLYETLSFLPDVGQNPGSGPLNYAISHYGISAPPGVVNKDYTVVFTLDQWAPFASLSSIFDESQSINAGFAVQTWWTAPFSAGVDILSHQPVSNIFTGINVDVAVRDSDAWIYRVGYNITLLGKIAFTPIPPGPGQTVVPPVLGDDAISAGKAISAAGLKPPNGLQKGYYVVGQNPAPYAPATIGSNVSLTLRQGVTPNP